MGGYPLVLSRLTALADRTSIKSSSVASAPEQATTNIEAVAAGADSISQ